MAKPSVPSLPPTLPFDPVSTNWWPPSCLIASIAEALSLFSTCLSEFQPGYFSYSWKGRSRKTPMQGHRQVHSRPCLFPRSIPFHPGPGVNVQIVRLQTLFGSHRPERAIEMLSVLKDPQKPCNLHTWCSSKENTWIHLELSGYPGSPLWSEKVWSKSTNRGPHIIHLNI